MIYAVTDIETTGGSPSGNSITEIAVVLTDGNEVIDEYQTLINPGRAIPHHITVLTGISTEMVEEAPYFEEIAEELHAFFDKHIFVAHNVNFDYSFLKAAFERCGLSFNQNKLCTVRYTRKVFPGIHSYSLGALVSHFGLYNDSPHRAMPDTRMALEILLKCLKEDNEQQILNEFLKRGKGDAFLPMNLNKESYHQLPEKAGVYYFQNETGKIIYVGKAKNIKKRIRQHFSGKLNTKKKQGLMRETYNIDFELTGTELIAALKEDTEIKRLWPKYNSAQKHQKRKVGVVKYFDQKGRVRLTTKPVKGAESCIISFSSEFKARQWLFEFREEYELPYARLNLPGELDEESESTDEELNDTINKAIMELKERLTTFFVKGEGRTLDEESFVLIENSTYKGYGFIPRDAQVQRIDELDDFLTYQDHSDFAVSVISRSLEENSKGLVINEEEAKT